MLKRKDYKVVKGLLHIGTDGETVPCEVEYKVGDGFFITVTVPSHKKQFHTTKKYYNVVTADSCMTKEPDNAFIKQYNSREFDYSESYVFDVCHFSCVITVDQVPEELTKEFKPDFDSRQQKNKTEYNKKAVVTLAAGAIGLGLGDVITSSIKKKHRKKKAVKKNK